MCVALPIIVYQLWAFLAPAFDEKDQKVVSRCVVAATFLFAGGVLFSYFIVLPSATPFLLGFDSDQYDIQLRARDYFSFVGMTSVFTGLVFELPVILLALVRDRSAHRATGCGAAAASASSSASPSLPRCPASTP